MAGRTGDIIGPATLAALHKISDAGGADDFIPMSRVLDVDFGAVHQRFIEIKAAGLRLTSDAKTILEFSRQLDRKP